VFIKVPAQQIPLLWEHIKFAVVSADRIDERDLQNYLGNLLGDLLSDKAQCFVRMDEQRMLLAVVITRVMFDEMTGYRSLLIQCLYSFKPVSTDEWITNMNIVEAYAIKRGCKKVIAYSTNPRVFELAAELGFNERYRCFIKEV